MKERRRGGNAERHGDSCLQNRHDFTISKSAVSGVACVGDRGKLNGGE